MANQTYFCTLTAIGEAKDANAKALGTALKLTEMAVGDGNGALPTPDRARTSLVRQVRRAPLNTLKPDPLNPGQLIAEQIIPEDVGGWWIRELGIYDDAGDLIAIGNCPETYKPQLAEGSGRVQVVRMVLIMSSAATVQLKIDPSVVLATRKYADDQDAAHAAAADPHPQYLTEAEGAARIQAAVQALVNSSPATLDTLAELAAALNNDKDFAVTITNALALKAPKDSPTFTGNLVIGAASGGYSLTVARSVTGDLAHWYYNGGAKSPYFKMTADDDTRVRLQYGNSDSTANLLFSAGPVEVAQSDRNGNLLVGVANGSTHTAHRLQKDVGEGTLVCGITGNLYGTYFYAAGAGILSTSKSGLEVYKNSTTNRSINAAGTINASGADYAEYMTKADNCGAIAKGDIVGVNADGALTDKWSNAVSFLIKSTDPSYVGGDVWGSQEALGVDRPVEPVFEAPAYTGSEKPTELAEGEASWSERDAALAQYEADQKKHVEATAAARQEFDTVTMPAYRAALAEFESILEAARQKVDRIAYCGQVPVNVMGAKPGQYVVPVQDGEGIGGQLVDGAAIDFQQYRRAVGIVQNVLEDGRANVRVKPV